MNSSVARLARRVAVDPFFLAFALAEYAAVDKLDDAGLAAALGVPPDVLPAVRLCRSPRAEPAGFREDVDRIVARFGADRGVLVTAVRHGQTVAAMRAVVAPDGAAAGSLLAARDRPAGP